MKILALSNLYPPDFIGGYELACADVVDALRDRGHDVRVLTAAPRLPVDSPPHVLRRLKLIDEWSENGMGATPFSFRRTEAESRLISAYNVHALITVLEDFQPDVVYVCAVTGLGGFGLLACLQYLGAPWVWQLGDRIPHHLCSTRQSVIPGLADAFTRYIRGCYIVVSTQLRREIETTGIGLGDHVEVIPNWITGVRGPHRRDYYRGGRLRILTAGQLARWKGTDLLIKAAAQLRDSGRRDFEIDLYGRVHQPDLVSLVRTFDLADHVTFKGVLPRARLLEAYGEYDLFAFPTLEREPFGLVPLEAVARGCVPVMTRHCGVAEWLVHGVHCLKGERTAESFSQIFIQVADRFIDLEPIARRGAAAAWRDFHLDVILPRIERLLVRAASRITGASGSSQEAYRLARMAEQLTAALLQEASAA